MTVLEMDPAKFPAPAKALYDRIAARRRAKGEGFGCSTIRRWPNGSRRSASI